MSVTTSWGGLPISPGEFSPMSSVFSLTSGSSVFSLTSGSSLQPDVRVQGLDVSLTSGSRRLQPDVRAQRLQPDVRVQSGQPVRAGHLGLDVSLTLSAVHAGHLGPTSVSGQTSVLGTFSGTVGPIGHGSC